MNVLRNCEARSCSHCCSGRAISITYSECVFVALGFHHAMRMRYIVICGLPSCTIFFSHYLINGKIFEKKNLNVKCVLFFSANLSEQFLVLRRTEWGKTKKAWIFSIYFRKILQYQISWKFLQWETSYWMRTDMAKLEVACRNSAKEPKN